MSSWGARVFNDNDNYIWMDGDQAEENKEEERHDDNGSKNEMVTLTSNLKGLQKDAAPHAGSMSLRCLV